MYKMVPITAPKLSHEPYTQGEEQTKLQFTISDQWETRNYYRFRVFTFDIFTQTNKPNTFTIEGITGTGEDLNFSTTSTSFFIDDDLFDGRDLTWILSLRSIKADSAIVEVTSLSEASFRYLKSLDIAGKNFIDLNPILSNVKNGLGIVGGISVNKILIK